MVAYCTANQVAAFLQVDNFSGSSTPTSTNVESFIEMAEERIDQMTEHAWSTARAKSVTEERVRIQRVRSNVINTRGRIQLEHFPILSFTQHATPSLAQTNGNVKVWNGSKYLDYLDTDESKDMGSSVTDVVSKDFWADTERGLIYLNNYSTFNMVNSSPAGVDGYISYKYGTASTPDDIKLATIYLSAAMIAMNDDLNLMQEGDDSMDNASRSQKFEEMGLKILKDNKRVGRKMIMATGMGGFGTGMVAP
tara:strand:+ start:31 stop:783 length:753 start_codon:yes stop_codon:yes gene_type:complete